MSAMTVMAEVVEADAPPEARGVPRDGVRLLAAYGGGRLGRRDCVQLAHWAAAATARAT